MSLNGYAAVRMCLMRDSALLSVWLTPRAARDEVVGWQGEELRLRLRAPPVEGQANEALRRFLARRLGLPASAIELVAGAASRHKRLRIAGLSEAGLREGLHPIEGTN